LTQKYSSALSLRFLNDFPLGAITNYLGRTRKNSLMIRPRALNILSLFLVRAHTSSQIIKTNKKSRLNTNILTHGSTGEQKSTRFTNTNHSILI